MFKFKKQKPSSIMSFDFASLYPTTMMNFDDEMLAELKRKQRLKKLKRILQDEKERLG